MAAHTFREWLNGEIDRQDIRRRELARRLATKHPEGVNAQTIETYRRAIYKYLDPTNPTVPTLPTRTAFAIALGVDPAEVPDSDDESEGRDLNATLQALAREQAELSRRLSRVLKAAGA
jgi:hypothetical protein